MEQALAEAKAAANEPWSERIEGARRGAHDAQVEPVEAEAEAAVAEMTAACHTLAAYARREAAAQQIGALAAHVGRVQPGDVGPSTHAEALAREATTASGRRTGTTPAA